MTHAICVAAITIGFGQTAAMARRSMASPARKAAQTTVRRRMLRRKPARAQWVSNSAAASAVAHIVSRAR